MLIIDWDYFVIPDNWGEWKIKQLIDLWQKISRRRLVGRVYRKLIFVFRTVYLLEQGQKCLDFLRT